MVSPYVLTFTYMGNGGWEDVVLKAQEDSMGVMVLNSVRIYVKLIMNLLKNSALRAG